MKICQRCIISLDGPVVTLAGLKDELAVVTHCSPSLPSEEQVKLYKNCTSISVLAIPLIVLFPCRCLNLEC